jgi:peptide/nickel transport system substrate-binding protein
MTLAYMGLDDIVHREEIGEAAYGVNPSGLGPFKLKEWKRGEYLIFEAFDDYWAGRPQIDEIHYYIIPEATSQLMALETGDVDIITALPPHEVPTVEAASDLEIVMVKEMRAAQLPINVNDPRGVLSDIRVRKGIAHAMNSAEFEDALYPALSPIDGVVHSGVMGHVPGLKYEHDPQKAKQFLNEAGWYRDDSGWFKKNGITVSFDIQTPRGQAALDWEICELVQTQLADFGVRVGIQLFESGAWADLVTSQRNVAKPELGVITEFFGVRTGDPTIMFDRMYSTGGLYNVSHYSNEEYDRLVELAKTTFSMEEKKDAFRKLQQIIHDDVLQWTFGTVNILYARNKDVKGFHVTPPQSIWWEKVWLDR